MKTNPLPLLLGLDVEAMVSINEVFTSPSFASPTIFSLFGSV